MRKDAPADSEPLAHIGFSNTYARLPERFYARINPTPVSSPKLIRVNVDLAKDLGLDPEALQSPEGVSILAGNGVASGSQPLAMAYAGHQFGHLVPQLGDGRANLLGEVLAPNGSRYDLHLKGSGPTPFSRRGDGRAALGPVLREYLISEAMAALGVPTTRALAAVTTGERVLRETAVPGAIFTRVASSHLRVGTFEYFAIRGDLEGTRLLADYAIARHYPQASNAQPPYRTFLDAVISRQASLIAQWMLLGFIHGVMNTDNMAISGETLDFGPCAFMEAYHPETVFSSIDVNGRYAYGNQPFAAHWNLSRLAESLLPLLVEEEGSEEAGLLSAQAAINAFEPQFAAARRAGLCRKLGLLEQCEGDSDLAEDLLQRMAANKADFTLTFRLLADSAASPDLDAKTRSLFAEPVAFDTWAARWRERCSADDVPAAIRAESMRKLSPLYIPRNHKVEEALAAAVLGADFIPFEKLLNVLAAPFQERPGLEAYALPARAEEYVHQTFCGT